MKRLITTFLALMLLVLTIYSASAIEISSIADDDKVANIGLDYSLQLSLVDNENLSNIVFGLKSGPDGMSIASNGLVSWMPMFKHGDLINVVANVSAYNSELDENVSAEKAFQLEVSFEGFSLSLNTNNAPRSAVVDDEYTFQLSASSNRQAAVEEYMYGFVDNQRPDGMVMSSSGEISWTPSTDQFGTHTVRVFAIPKDAPSDIRIEREFSITVQGMSIDRVEVRADGRRLETISRANYLTSSIPYVISRDANLGETIELRISVRNNLPDGTDNELRDVEIEIYSFDLLSADGQDAFISRIRAGRTEDQTISFELDPRDLHPDDSPFDIEIRVFGETRGGELYSDSWILELRLESRSYDLFMSNIVLSSTAVCPGDRLRVSLDLRNVGTRDLSNAGIRYYVQGLDINEWERPIRIDYDESRTVTRFLDIPSNAVVGDYFLEINAYPRTTSSSDVTTEFLTFNVRSCEPVVDDDDDEDDTIIVTPKPPQDVVVPGTPITDTVGRSKSIFDRDNNVYVVLLTALVVLLLVGVILLLVSVFRK